MASGPIVIGYDGSPESEHALRVAGGLLATRPALVVVVWKESLGTELVLLPAAIEALPLPPIDIHAAREVDEAVRERAQRLAAQGAGLAAEAGLEAEGLAVADDLEVPVAETLARVARERDAAAIVVGEHRHGPGSTVNGVIRRASAPVVVVRGAGD